MKWPTRVLPNPRLLLAGVLLTALLGLVAVMQWHQGQLVFKVMMTSTDFGSNYFYQAGFEYLRLRETWARYRAVQEGPDKAAALTELRTRFEVFASRVNVLRESNTTADMASEDAVMRGAITAAMAFVSQADDAFAAEEHAKSGTLPAALYEALMLLDQPIRALTLGATHKINENANARVETVHRQNRWGVALTLFLCVLTALFAGVALNQLRHQRTRQRGLEAMAAEMRAAQLSAQAASQAKSTFLANMSHEIRTPFHGLLGMLAMAEKEPPGERLSKYLQTARASADHLLTLLNDILDLSRLESGQMHLNPQPALMSEVIQPVTLLMQPLAENKGLRFALRLEPDVPQCCVLDTTRVRQVVFNLVGNAIKFSERGQVSVTVGLANGPGHGWLQVAVSDTGPGIAPQVLAQLFQRFTQGDGSLQRKHGGAGLGLQISRELARLMGGDIEARSQLGAGSVFTLRLPLQPAHSAQEAPANATALSPASPAPTALRVLVADDNEVNRLYMEGALNLLQHQCTLVDDGEQALQAASAQRFDVIFLDLHMPQRDGFSTATALRANLAGLNAHTPLVALTADVFDDTRQRCIAAGMNAFLAKPASPQDIARCLAERVPQARAQAAPLAQPELAS